MTDNAKHAVTLSAPGAGESFSAMDERMIIRAQFEGWTAFEMDFGTEVKVPPHLHPWAEVYFALSGGLNMMVDGVEYQVPAGTLISIPGGVAHQPRGPAAEDTRMLVLMGPGSDPQMFRELSAVTANGVVDQEQVLPILKRFGVQPIGPSD